MMKFNFIYSLLFLSLALTGCQNMAGGLGTKLSGTNNSGGGSEATPDPAFRSGDRYYTASVLTNLMIPANPGSETVLKNTLLGQINTGIINQVGDFGGPCDNFLGSGFPVPSAQQIGPDCRDNSLSKVSAIMLPTSIRAALIMKTVYKLLDSNNSDMPLRNIIALSRGISFLTSANLNVVTAPTTSDLRSLFTLVYPGVTPADDTIDKINSYASSMNQQFGAKEAWRYAALLMISPLVWQIP